MFPQSRRGLIAPTWDRTAWTMSGARRRHAGAKKCGDPPPRRGAAIVNDGAHGAIEAACVGPAQPSPAIRSPLARNSTPAGPIRTDVSGSARDCMSNTQRSVFAVRLLVLLAKHHSHRISVGRIRAHDPCDRGPISPSGLPLVEQSHLHRLGYQEPLHQVAT